MAKKKLNIDAHDAVDTTVAAVPTEPQTVSAIPENLSKDKDSPIASKGSQKEQPAPSSLPPAAPTKKKRVRIRKKAAKKLSAAIICQNPNITRFI